jgi:hypothetical protein
VLDETTCGPFTDEAEAEIFWTVSKAVVLGYGQSIEM